MHILNLASCFITLAILTCMNIQAICFDMDGIIVDSEPAHMKAFDTTLRKYGVIMRPDDYKTYFSGKPGPIAMGDFFAAHAIQLDVRQVMAAKDAWYMKYAIRTTTIYRETIEFIKVNSLGLPCALVTSSSSSVVYETLRYYKLEGLFDPIVTLDDTTKGKPDPEGYLSAASLLGIPALNCAAIEDSPSGVSAAKHAGMYCIALTTTHTVDDLAEADIVVDRLNEKLFLKH